MRREVGVLVVALRQVEGAFLLDPARKQAHEGLRRDEGTGGERAAAGLGAGGIAGQLERVHERY
ncbi:MAG: hypothetical protein P8X94_14950, partial [Woeseiaceae bacterium]